MEPVPGGHPRRPVIRTYRSGCGCFPSILALPVIVAIAVIVVFLITRGGDTGSATACDLFGRSFGPERESSANGIRARRARWERLPGGWQTECRLRGAGGRRGAVRRFPVPRRSSGNHLRLQRQMGSACAKAGYGTMATRRLWTARVRTCPCSLMDMQSSVPAAVSTYPSIGACASSIGRSTRKVSNNSQNSLMPGPLLRTLPFVRYASGPSAYGDIKQSREGIGWSSFEPGLPITRASTTRAGCPSTASPAWSARTSRVSRRSCRR